MNTMLRNEGPATIDFEAVKARQKATWSAGDYAAVGCTLQIVGELLCEAVDLRAGAQVLDVAAGNGNATLAAARRFADVISTDYVGALLDRGRRRAEAEGLRVTFQEADAERLPFADGSFDVVLSTFGVMFAPNQPQVARELLRVCRAGGRIGLANWTPGGFIGRVLGIVGKYLPPPPGIESPMIWGGEDRLRSLFGAEAQIRATAANFVFRYKSAGHWLEFFRTYYGPVLKAFAALEPGDQARLDADIRALIEELNVARDGTVVVPGEYLEVIVTKPG